MAPSPDDRRFQSEGAKPWATLSRCARDGFGLAPGGDAVIGSDAKNIALASPSKRPLNGANAVDAIGGDKGKRHRSGNGPLDHGDGQSRLGCKGRFLRDVRRL